MMRRDRLPYAMHECVNKLARHLHNFGLTWTAAALNKGEERGVDDGAALVPL